jgi:hypothetical protein
MSSKRWNNFSAVRSKNQHPPHLDVLRLTSQIVST